VRALVREIDLWCSSSMVACEGREPVAVLLGAKRPQATLVHAVRVHPDHRRRGHGRHLLESLAQKLAILGPPRIVAELPADRAPARALFEACGFRCAARLVDWHRPGAAPSAPASAFAGELAIAEIALEEARVNGLLDPALRPWRRDLAALERAGGAVAGLGLHSPARLEACLFFRARAADAGVDLLAAGAAPGEIGRGALRILLGELARRAAGAALRLARAAPEEIDPALLGEAGFRRGAEWLLYTGEAKGA
jgi:hypothetical protein